MAERFFLMCTDPKTPVVEIDGVTRDEFMKLATSAFEGADGVRGKAVGLTVDVDNAPDDMTSVDQRDMNFAVATLLMRRELLAAKPKRFKHGKDPKKVLKYLKKVWGI